MATFDYQGTAIRVIPQHEIELRDLDFMRENFEVPGMVELEQGMADLEPVAWRAILVASIRREKTDVDPKTDAVDGVALLPLIQELNEERAAQMEAEEEAAKTGKRKGRARPTSRSKG